ncbi:MULTISPECIES: D-alanyl-D-alanine carboxypeptidase family protein [unclassified Virgibacillus]|uniref:D-alanyl-D-alanine carboxypeptidase family protein n=1 Tax=unclassified Virgibacillus TaxID=2620237 RepID=UPI0024DED562|nr:D-alanyl-D-alanine carboxypeptidase family protein [Virgibacillus sp. LDC-1]
MFNKYCRTFILMALTILIATACNATPNEPTDTKENVSETATPKNPDSQQNPQVDKQDDTTNKPTLPFSELQKGDTGKQVSNLQQVLIQAGYAIKNTDVYDSETVWAITDFQMQTSKEMITGIYTLKTKQLLEKVLANQLAITPGKALPWKKSELTADKKVEVSNPYEILVLVNKSHALPETFIPEDLVTPAVRFPFSEDLPKKQMRKPAAEALEKMFAAADKAGVDLFAQSGYRSFTRQQSIFAANVSKNGEEAANKYSARPGESEHQTGLTMDVTSPAVSFDLIIEFGETPEGKWIQTHASEFGFIIRYPKGKEEITKYQYEPWHLRFVGKKAAKEITDNKLTLEEYVEKLN